MISIWRQIWRENSTHVLIRIGVIVRVKTMIISIAGSIASGVILVRVKEVGVVLRGHGLDLRGRSLVLTRNGTLALYLVSVLLIEPWLV